MSRGIDRSRARREELYERIDALQNIRNGRTPHQQLEMLDERLGDGMGAIKERKRMHYLIENPPKRKKEKKGDTN
jgi:hypothetical protein